MTSPCDASHCASIDVGVHVSQRGKCSVNMLWACLFDVQHKYPVITQHALHISKVIPISCSLWRKSSQSTYSFYSHPVKAESRHSDICFHRMHCQYRKDSLWFVQYHFSLMCQNVSKCLVNVVSFDLVKARKLQDVVQSDIKVSWCSTVCFGFYPRFHWHQIAQSDKKQT